MTFPTANSSVYYNEDGEVLGWDEPLYDEDNEPDYSSMRDFYANEPDVWGDEEACKREGYHGESGNSVEGRDDVWQCAACGGHYPREADDPLGMGSPAWDLDD